MTGMTPKPPTIAILLGGLGLLPFLAAAILHLPGFQPEHIVVPWREYGALILSFMGGAHWGLAMNRSGNGRAELRRYGASILPALVGWICLFLDSRLGMMTLVAGLGMLAFYDVWTVKIGEAPSWYGALRLGLTAIVGACLVVGIIEGGWL